MKSYKQFKFTQCIWQKKEKKTKLLAPPPPPNIELALQTLLMSLLWKKKQNKRADVG